MNTKRTPTANVFVLPSGYREASIDGARLIVRPDGSESWTNVQPDSELYAALNAALFAIEQMAS